MRPQVRWAPARLWAELKDTRLDEMTWSVRADRMRAEGRVKQEELKRPKHKTEKEQPPRQLGGPEAEKVKYCAL